MHKPPSQSVDDTAQGAQAHDQAAAHGSSAPLTELHHELTEKEVSRLGFRV